MTPSENCYALARFSEGLRLHAYKNKGDVWTIGYGHTGKVFFLDSCTEAEAETMLRDDMAIAAAGVTKFVKVVLSQNQFDALCDFVFNLGAGALAGSTLLKYLNAGHYEAAAEEFHKWCHDHAGNVLAGLVTRREAERQLFMTPDAA